MVPQITDPRIIVQTFNAPNAPILPSTFPKPKINLKVNLPSPIKPLKPLRIKRYSPGVSKDVKTVDELIEDDVTKAFLDALSENHHLGKHSKYINSLKDEVPVTEIKLY